MSISRDPTLGLVNHLEAFVSKARSVAKVLWPCAALLLTLSGCGRSETGPSAPRLVETIVVAPAQGETTAVYSGEVVSRYEAQLGFRTAGTIIGKYVDVGDTVVAGQALARLDPTDAELGVASASAQASAAARTAHQQDIDLDRAQRLANEGFISRAELDRQRVGAGQANAQARTAQAQLQGARRQVGYTVLRAERGGVITAFNGAEGQVVPAGQPIVTVAAPGVLEAAISIPEGELATFSSARLTVAAWTSPDQNYVGRIRTLSPAANRQTRTFDARISFDAPPKAAPIGATVEVQARMPVGGTSFRVPVSAVSQRSGMAAVWIVSGNPARVAPRQVQIVQVQQNGILVSGGIRPGDRVVTAGIHLLHPGDLVRPVAASAETTR